MLLFVVLKTQQWVKGDVSNKALSPACYEALTSAAMRLEDVQAVSHWELPRGSRIPLGRLLILAEAN